jgi:hypothetical protein
MMIRRVLEGCSIQKYGKKTEKKKKVARRKNAVWMSSKKQREK